VVPESERSLRLEIGHVLFIDLVGYSKLPIEEQKERLAQLTEIVLATAQVREAPNEQLVRLPTGDGETRVARAVVDVDERADTDPRYRTIHDILATTPGSESTVAQQWIWLSLARRDVAEGERAAAALSETGLGRNGLVFPRPFCRAVFAQLRGDRSAMQDELLKAREETEAKLQAAPDYGPTLVILGLIDAALGRKEDAIREGKRATEVMPITRKSIEGAQIITYLAVIYAWTGEKDLAIDRLEESARIPAGVSYGDLKLLSYFDALRGNPRFEQIVADLAQKAGPNQ